MNEWISYGCLFQVKRRRLLTGTGEINRWHCHEGNDSPGLHYRQGPAMVSLMIAEGRRQPQHMHESMISVLYLPWSRRSPLRSRTGRCATRRAPFLIDHRSCLTVLACHGDVDNELDYTQLKGKAKTPVDAYLMLLNHALCCKPGRVDKSGSRDRFYRPSSRDLWETWAGLVRLYLE